MLPQVLHIRAREEFVHVRRYGTVELHGEQFSRDVPAALLDILPIIIRRLDTAVGFRSCCPTTADNIALVAPNRTIA